MLRFRSIARALKMRQYITIEQRVISGVFSLINWNLNRSAPNIVFGCIFVTWILKGKMPRPWDSNAHLFQQKRRRIIRAFLHLILNWKTIWYGWPRIYRHNFSGILPLKYNHDCNHSYTHFWLRLHVCSNLLFRPHIYAFRNLCWKWLNIFHHNFSDNLLWTCTYCSNHLLQISCIALCTPCHT